MAHSRGMSSTSLLAFALGVLLVTYLPALPAWRYLAALSLVIVALWRRSDTVVLAWMLLGCFWHVYCGQKMMSAEMPAAWEGRALLLEGRVSSLVQRSMMADGGYRSRFTFEVRRASLDGRALHLRRPLLVRLDWYNVPGDVGNWPSESSASAAGNIADDAVGASANRSSMMAVIPNQQWQFEAALKRPRGLANPGTFDYRLWLLAQGIGATGKVIAGDRNQHLGDERHLLITWRHWYQQQLRRRLQGHESGALLAALAIGDRQQLTASQREVLAATGTAHLMVISGLHVGLSALFGFAGCFALLSMAPSWVQSGRAVLLARCMAFAVATAYAALAGFALPTQRALIMLLLFLLVRQSGREVISLRIWLLALFGVLVVNPMAVTAAGFWLSFAAVCLLMAPVAQPVVRLRWRLPGLSALSTQWRLSLGLCPLIALWGGQASLIAPLVNLVAIPFVGFLVVPVLLVALLILPFNDILGGLSLELARLAMELCWQGLEWAVTVSAHWSALALHPRPAALWLAMLAVLLFLLPRGIPGRVLWPLLLLPLLLPASAGRRGFDLYVLDVGQGTAVVVRSADKVLVYDTGPAYASGFDAGRAVLLPFLRGLGVSQVDRLIVSHGDIDHSGGAQALLKGIPVSSWMAPAAIDPLGEPDQFCRAGQRWIWSGVRFTIVHPIEPLSQQRNNRSCVLLIETAEASYLLAGDIERSAERALAAKLGPDLAADVLLVPHHGSGSSSSWDFAWFVRPTWAIISSGYGNRFGHPAAPVLRRYQELGAEVINTADSGALHFSAAGGYKPYRWFYTRYWHNYPCYMSASAWASWWLGSVWWPDTCIERPHAVKRTFL
jgi:competence protein ComEC